MTTKPTPRDQEKYAESPAYQPEEHPQMLSCPRCEASWAFYPKESFMSVCSAEWCGWCERAGPNELLSSQSEAR